jgi:TolA-binding protein
VLLAEARLARGDSAGALAAAEEALRHDPDEDTAATAIFVQWLVLHRNGDDDDAQLAAERLVNAYPEQPAALLVKEARQAPDQDHAFRWTWAFDGTLRFEAVDPSAAG